MRRLPGPLFLAVALLPAAAQTPDPAAPPQRLEPFTVTGTHLGDGAPAFAPVQAFDSGQLQAVAAGSNLLDLLRSASPAFAGAGTIGNENAQIGSIATYGGAEISLHALRTLVLVDGRRLPFHPAAAEGANEFTDLNLIPPSAVERVEVLPQGASAVYGADAIGGVVNIILRKEFDGWEAGARYGFTRNAGRYTERSGYLRGGAADGRTSLLVTVDAARSDPIYFRDRPYTNPIFGTYSYAGNLEVFSLSDHSDTFYRLNPALNAPPGGGQATLAQLIAAGVYIPITNAQALQGFNLANAETLVQSLRRASAAIELSRRFDDDRLEAFGQGLWTRVRTQSALNAQPLAPYVSTPYVDVQFKGATPPPAGTTVVPSTAAGDPFSTSYLNGNGDGASGNVVLPRNRFVAFPRLYRNESVLTHGVAGLRGRAGESLSWEAALDLNRDEFFYRNPGLVATAALNAGLASGAINPFAYQQAPGALNGVVGTGWGNMASSLDGADFVLRGVLPELPAGAPHFAVGGSYAREGLTAAVDPNSVPDPRTGLTVGWSGGNSLQPFDASRGIASAFAELAVPLAAPRQSLPGVHSLDLDLAVRLDRYSGVGSSREPQAGLVYEPAGDALKLRATLGRSFTAPTLYQLHGPNSTGTTSTLSYAKFTGGRVTGASFNAVTTPNLSLKPSTASVATGGFDWEPRDGLRLSGEFFDAHQSQIVGNLDPAAVVQDVELRGPASPYAPYVHFSNPAGPGVTAPGQISTTSSSNVYVGLPYVNQAEQEVRGFDAALRAALPPAAGGRFELSTAATVFNSYRLRQLPTDSYHQYAGHASTGRGTLPRYRLRTELLGRWKAAGATVAHSFVPAVTDIGAGGSAAAAPVPVGSYSQFDASAELRFGDLFPHRDWTRWTLRAGVENAFNRLPPVAMNAFPNTNADLNTYGGGVGRLWFMEGNRKF